MLITRRHLLALGAGGLALPSRAIAAPSASQRRFLFLHCDGGWDPAVVFASELLGRIDHEPQVTAAEGGGVPFIDSESRPAVRSFFQAHGDRTAVINGMEVASITHERCRRIVLTGQGDGSLDDWPSILAAHAQDRPLLPHLVLAGSAFSARHADQVVRVGDKGQLPKLLSGEAFELRDQGLIVPPSDVAEDAYLAAQLEALQASPSSQAEADFFERYGTALQAQQELQVYGSDLDLAPKDAGCERDLLEDAATLFDCFELGLSRCGMLAYKGRCGEGWDTHQAPARQDVNFQDLFDYLSRILADLDTRTAPEGGPLRDQVTLVVFSEMGRAPAFNTWLGKDHWTFTSVMLIGSGVRGGQAVGAQDGQARGLPIDLASGQASATGVRLSAAHLGATLLALGDVDPGEYTAAGVLNSVML